MKPIKKFWYNLTGRSVNVKLLDECLVIIRQCRFTLASAIIIYGLLERATDMVAPKLGFHRSVQKQTIRISAFVMILNCIPLVLEYFENPPDFVKKIFPDGITDDVFTKFVNSTQMLLHMATKEGAISKDDSAELIAFLCKVNGTESKDVSTQTANSDKTTERLSKQTSAKKKTKYVLNICEDAIQRYEGCPHRPSCKRDVMNLIQDRLLNAEREISEEWDESVDYMRVAHTMLAHACFDLLASGKYHIYAGELNPLSCADNLLDVYKMSMAYGVRIGEIDEETRREQYEYLLECISQAG